MKRNMFDILESTPNGIDENTVSPAFDIDPEKVIMGVHKKLAAETTKTEKTDNKKGGKNIMKKSHKKAAVILIAAALSAAALGTLTVSALGGFTKFLGEHSAGEPVNELYPGGDVSVTTSSGISGKFLGITGDDTNMVSLVQLTNTDGSDIIEKGKNSFIETNDYYHYFDKTCKQYEEEVVDILKSEQTQDIENLPTRKVKIWHEVGYDISDTTIPEFDNDADAKISHTIWFRDPFDTPYPCFVSYEMADSKTINCYLSSHIDSGMFRSLKGETLKAEDKNLYIYQIDKVLYQANTAEEYAYFIADYDKYNQLITDNIDSLNDNQVITLHDYSMVIATRQELEIDMNVLAKLNYKSNTKEFASTGTTFRGDNGIDFTIKKITAGSLSTDLELDYTLPDGANDYETFSTLFTPYDNDVYITLKSGEKINAQCIINRNYREHHTVTLNYFNSTDENVAKWMIVNPQEISSITFKGTTITK